MDWLVLAGAAAEAVSQVLVVVACGIILSRTGYLTQSAQKSISRVNLYFMTPCLLFTKIASTINWEQFKAFWPIPVFFVFFSFISWAVARIGSRALRFSSDEEKFVTASVLFSNTNSLPMALIQSLALSAAGSRLLRDENDTKEQVAARGISYILFYAIFGNLVRWSYGFSLLVPKDKEERTEALENQDVSASTDQFPQRSEGVLINVDDPSASGPGHTAAISSASSIHTLHEGQDLYRDDDTDEDDVDSTPSNQRSHDHSSFFRSSNNHKNQQQSTHLQPLSPPISGPSRTFPGLSRHQKRYRHRKSTKSMIRQKASSAVSRIRQVLTPPLLTAIIALVVGLVPALHRLFMGPESKLYSFIIHPIENCGAAAIPMILLCLGAQVVEFATSSSSSSSSITGQSSSNTGPVKPGQLQRRRSANTPSVFPHARQVSDSSSSGEDSQGEEWHRVQNPPRRESYGYNGIGSSDVHASSSTTLYNFTDSDNDEMLGSHSAYNGSSELSLQGHRFKWLSPVAFVLMSRLVVVPLICLPAILFQPGSLSPILTTDPTFALTLVLIVASPTAINLIQLAQVKGFFENDMAAVLFWSYCVFGVPCVLGWSLVGLWAAGR
ncbi:membrane transport protein-domain-containing protein [Gamsiella multidivaricata]|uniref:membrane transport protein-domain-containing protein n=1 Tax=Gamsiella multidivaricata TaxID=101098 RepID=UPI00221FB202|nr:membrane transport protein-domain-containing protein [Gamsiella multidivaricata]KAG0366039.1 hypothetical protein BGZ54_005896 [Gamsiella multidivaricata]KAI7825990.1 membrane transport protein-domain-containing protein [Gamsiella multidivaricata]